MEENIKDKPLITSAFSQPRIRSRSNLTSLQITKDQKQLIDQAYSLFSDQNNSFISKGQFVEQLCANYIRINHLPPMGH